MMPKTIYIVVNEYGEQCLEWRGSGVFFTKKAAREFARASKRYRVLAYQLKEQP